MKTAFDAVAAGHLCLDIFPDLSESTREDFRELLLPGHLLEIGPATFGTGGSSSNTGIALHKLGMSTRLMGKIGNDPLGMIIQDFIQRIDPALSENMIIAAGDTSSYTIVLGSPTVDRIFLHYPGPNDTFCAADIPYDVVARSRLFHFGYPPLMKAMVANQGEDLVQMFARVQALGVTTSLDLTLPDPTSSTGQAPWPHILRRTLPHVDIFLPSIAEILFMLRRSLYEEMRAQADAGDLLSQVTPGLLSDISAELLNLGVKIVGIKLGQRGMYLRTAKASAIAAMGRAQPSRLMLWADQEMWAPAFQVDVVGATGAGDATIAGFLAALLRDMSPDEALITATAVGACNVEAADSLSGVPSWQQLRARLEGGWARRALHLTAPGWRFKAPQQLWVRVGD